MSLLRVTFPYIFFISLAAFAAAILQCHGRFAVPAFTPAFLNLSLIVAALWMTRYFQEPVMALAWGVLAGGAAQLLFQLPFVLRLGFFPVPRIAPMTRGSGACWRSWGRRYSGSRWPRSTS